MKREVTGFDVLGAGSLLDAERFRISGEGTMQAMQSNMATIQNVRHTMLQQAAGGQVAGEIMKRIGTDPITQSRIEAAIQNMDMDPVTRSITRARIIGTLAPALAMQAEHFGYANAHAMDLGLEAISNSEALRGMGEAVGGYGASMEIFQETGALRGIGGLLAALKKDDPTVNKALRGFFGAANLRADAAILQVTESGQRIGTAVGGRPDMKMAADFLVEAVTLGTVGGRAISKEQQDKARMLYQSASGKGVTDDKIREDLQAFAIDVNADPAREADVLALARKLSGAGSEEKMLGEINEDIQKTARDRVTLEEFKKRGDADMRGTAESVLKMMEGGVTEKAAIKSTFASRTEGERQTFERSLGRFREEIPGYGAAGTMEAILDVLRDIFVAIKQDPSEGTFKANTGSPSAPVWTARRLQ
jgi:hypothetical protein